MGESDIKKKGGQCVHASPSLIFRECPGFSGNNYGKVSHFDFVSHHAHFEA